MEKLLVLGTTPTSIELINMAKARGVYTITTDYLEPEESPAKLVSDEYWMISTGDLDVLEQKCREEGITAVITGVSENNIRYMTQLCQRLNLPCWCTPQSWDAIQKKDEFKRLCREHGVSIAKDYFLSNPPTEEELNEIQFPVVVKPVDLNFSKGVSFCNTKEEVVRACAYARELSSCETVIVERMLSGVFCMTHFALADGEVSNYELVRGFQREGVSSKYGGFVISVNELRARYEKEMLPAITRLLKAAGCKDGICWVQNFYEDGHFYAMEMGYRLPADMINFAMKNAMDFDPLEWLLDIALGIKHTPADLPVPRNNANEACACASFIWSSKAGTIKRIEGIEEIRKIPGVYVRLVAKEGVSVEKFTLMLALSFDAENREHAVEKLKRINDIVKVYDENGEDMLFRFEEYDHVLKLDTE